MSKWWKEAVGYQIYVRSFYDENNDGIGDIRGIIAKLDYFTYLGINLIWLCPFYKSPMADNGYDVSDYYAVAPEFGTINDLQQLIDECHQRNIKVVADLVLNHTSNEHQWFVESRKSKDNKYRDYYIWEAPQYAHGKELAPTNWQSIFGGSCWQKDETTNEYYMKVFSASQPDLNWKNPQMRSDMQKMAIWWLDKGIDGFRIDAVAHIGKRKFANSRLCKKANTPDFSRFSNLPVIHDYLKEFNQNVFANYDVVTIGEVGGNARIKDGLKYINPKRKELDLIFTFDHVNVHNLSTADNVDSLVVNLLQLKKNFNYWQRGLKRDSWPVVFWLNHDHMRLMSCYGDYQNHNLSGKMLATAMYFMRGTPFIYNGEEIGMTNYPFTKIDEFNDVQVKIEYGLQVTEKDFNEKSFVKSKALTTRDNARTPMQWNKQKNGGFTKGQPWMKVNPNYQEINVESQMGDENSLLNFYRKIITLRRHSVYHQIITFGEYKQLYKKHPKVYCYCRTLNDECLMVICNFFNEECTIPFENFEVRELLISNYHDYVITNKTILLRPYEAIVLSIKYCK